jgi:thiol-disulfide isomerase/thioredoxin
MRASDLSTSKTTRRAVLGLILLTITGLRVANAAPALKNWTGPNPAPAIDLNTLDGRPFRLEQLRGKVVLVNFWATWCEPCVEEMPSMQRLRNLLANAPFEIVAVNHQEGEARIRGFLQKVPLDFPIVRDTDGAVTRAWQTRIFPTSYLVDAEGKIRYVLAGATDWSAPATVRTVESLLPRRQAAR